MYESIGIEVVLPDDDVGIALFEHDIDSGVVSLRLVDGEDRLIFSVSIDELMEWVSKIYERWINTSIDK